LAAQFIAFLAPAEVVELPAGQIRHPVGAHPLLAYDVDQLQPQAVAFIDLGDRVDDDLVLRMLWRDKKDRPLVF
jgi:hypothetical protein